MINPYRVLAICAGMRQADDVPEQTNIVRIDPAADRRAAARHRFLHGGATVVAVDPMVDWREIAIQPPVAAP